MSPRQQTFDSNGPDVRVRGNAYQVLEKYLALARDASAAGDRISAENFLQHAEHYYRLINAHNDGNGRNNRPGGPDRQPNVHGGPEQPDGDEDEEGLGEADSMQAAAARGQHRRFNGGERGERNERGERDEPGDEQP
jgi:hypothetical protein